MSRPPRFPGGIDGARWRSPRWATAIRRRRGSDGLRLVAAVISLLVCLLIIRYGYRVDSVITRVVNPPPASISWLVTLVYDAGAFGVTAVLVVAGARRSTPGSRP